MDERKKGALLLAAGLGSLMLARKLSDRYSFKDRVVLITGGSRGLGLVLARGMAREGARLALCARDAGELARAQNELQAMGAEVFVRPCDVTNRGKFEISFRPSMSIRATLTSSSTMPASSRRDRWRT